MASLLAASTVLADPPAEREILERLQPGHPRLLVRGGFWETLPGHSKSSPELRAIAQGIRADAGKFLEEPVSTYEIPDGLRLLHTSRRVLACVKALAMAYRLTGDERFRARAWDELQAVAAFKDWNPRHFLDTAEMTHAVAIGYDWLYETWTPEQRSVLRNALVEKGLKPALAAYENKDRWTAVNNNWNQVCNGGIGAGALAVADEEPELCGAILENVLAHLPVAMAEYGPDGAWAEGPMYWDYATRYNVMILAALESALGTDFGLADIEGFSRTALFAVYLSSPGGKVFNYADTTDDSTPSSPHLYWLARRFQEPLALAFADRHGKPDAYSLIWRKPVEKTPEPLAPGRLFRGSEVVVFRGAGGVFLAGKAGDNDVSHSQLDLGTWVFDALGERWVTNLGRDNYNLPGYWDRKNQRWTYYRLRAEGHNTLVFNPGSGPDQNPQGAGKIVRFEPQSAVADLTAAYDGSKAKSVRRNWRLIDGKTALVEDEFELAEPGNAWWFFHTEAAVELAGDARTAVLSQNGKRVRVELLAPEGARFEVREAAPFPESPQPPNQDENPTVRKLAIHLSGVTQGRFAVTLAPETTGPK